MAMTFQEFQEKAWPQVRGFVVGAGIAAVIWGVKAAVFPAPRIADIETGPIETARGVLEFQLANTGRYAGDLVFRVVQGGIERCVGVTWVPAHSRSTVTMTCPGIENGRFKFRRVWAVHAPGKAAVATRIPRRR